MTSKIKILESFCKTFDQDIFSGHHVTSTPTETFEAFSEEKKASVEYTTLLAYYMNYVSYFSYLFLKWSYVEDQLETLYKETIKTAVLDQSKGSSDAKRIAYAVQQYSLVNSARVDATSKSKQYKSLVEIAQSSLQLTSRSYTIEHNETQAGSKLND
jgi:hypothetical protein